MFVLSKRAELKVQVGGDMDVEAIAKKGHLDLLEAEATRMKTRVKSILEAQEFMEVGPIKCFPPCTRICIASRGQP